MRIQIIIDGKVVAEGNVTEERGYGTYEVILDDESDSFTISLPHSMSEII